MTRTSKSVQRKSKKRRTNRKSPPPSKKRCSNKRQRTTPYRGSGKRKMSEGASEPVHLGDGDGDSDSDLSLVHIEVDEDVDPRRRRYSCPVYPQEEDGDSDPDQGRHLNHIGQVHRPVVMRPTVQNPISGFSSEEDFTFSAPGPSLFQPRTTPLMEDSYVYLQEQLSILVKELVQQPTMDDVTRFMPVMQATLLSWIEERGETYKRLILNWYHTNLCLFNNVRTPHVHVDVRLSNQLSVQASVLRIMGLWIVLQLWKEYLQTQPFHLSLTFRGESTEGISPKFNKVVAVVLEILFKSLRLNNVNITASVENAPERIHNLLVEYQSNVRNVVVARRVNAPPTRRRSTPS